MSSLTLIEMEYKIMKHKKTLKLFDPAIVKEAVRSSFVKLNPVYLLKNPVMFTVEVGTVIMLIVSILTIVNPLSEQGSFIYNFIITILLFLTLLFANFAEAIAEERGKAQAASLRKTREDTPAKLVLSSGSIKIINSSELKKGDIYLVEVGDTLPADGEIVEGLASIDESAITGESASKEKQIISSVIGGTRVFPKN
jgi:K+-transporting ATPase ATPase B chain